MPPHTYDGVKTIISSLGGPFLDDADVAAAASLEAGKILLAWLQSQVPNYQEECVVAGNVSSGSTREEHGKALVKDVALEKDEVPFTEQDGMNSSKGVQVFSAYIPPSRLRIHANFIKEESDQVRRQIDQLTFRISQTKEASSKLLQSIKSLQRNFDALLSNTRNSEERVAELCINTDAGVSTTISDVKQLLQYLGYSSANMGAIAEGNDTGMASSLQSASDFLLDTSNRISTTTDDLRNALNTLSTVKGTQPAKTRDLQNESIRLRNAFNSFKVEQDIDEDLQNELRDICLLLEHEVSAHSETGSQSDLLTTLLSEVDGEESTHGVVGVYDLHVEKLFRHAWAQDQIVILKLENDVLDEAYNSLSLLLEPLRSLHRGVFTLVNCIQEGEAVVEAFVEELEGVKLPENDNIAVPDSEDAIEIERELKRVLTENRDYRSPDVPPLLLQNGDDVLFELRALSSRLQTIEQAEREFSKELIHQTSIRPLHAALPEIYANSPLTSSPALAFPAQVQQMEDFAKKTAEELRGLANSLEEESQNTYARDNNIKRLDAFVEKWTRA